MNNPRGGAQFDRGRGRGGDRGRGGFAGDRGRGRGRADSPQFGGGRGRGGDGARGRGGGGGPRGGFGGAPGIFAEGKPAVVAPRLSDNEQANLVKSLQAISISTKDPKRPVRPGFGTLGRPITLRANFFAVRLPKGPWYDYEIATSPKTDINRLRTRIIDLLEQTPRVQQIIGHIAHDHSQRLISSKQLPQPLAVQFPFLEEGETKPSAKATTYTVEIKLVRTLDLTQMQKYLSGDPQWRDYDVLPLISALNLVLHQQPTRTGVRLGRGATGSKHFFPPDRDEFKLSPALRGWRGYFSSVRPTFKQLAVNVNVCMAAFVEPGNLAANLQAFGRNTHGAMPNLPGNLVKSIKVTTRHLGYKKRSQLKQIMPNSARNTYFDCEEFGGRISVENYFARKYKIKLEHPADLPVVDVGGKRHNYLPAELCVVEPGQVFRGKLNDRETTQMIRDACIPPNVNANLIVNQGFSKLGFSPLASPANGFDVSVDTEMAVVPARVLNPPPLSYRVGKPNVREGSWNILDVKFHRGAQVPSWWVLVVRDGNRSLVQGPTDPNLKNLVEAFSAKLRNSGMSVPQGLPRLFTTPVLESVDKDPRRAGSLEKIEQAIKDELAKVQGRRPSFILVLLSNRDNYIYPGIKRIGDVKLGIHTIHMQLEKALNEPRKQDQYLSNIALKVNTKLGGVNHLLDTHAMAWLTKKKTMMVGIDVTHPGPGSKGGTPSIAAVVASVDSDFVQFPCSLRIQKSKQEMLASLTDMLVERLQAYEAKNRSLPDRILIFRDGVSEGQYDTVLEEELPQMERAFQKFNTAARGKRYRPTLSIIICGKRHHASFYPTDSANATKNGNTLPGTVVDKGVTGVFDFDFYLQAHAGLQGKVRPTHYIVIYDESGLSADEIQSGTHNISYLYARATKAVSLMPPAYYADLACERGRCYLNDFLTDDVSVSGSTTGSARGSRDQEEERVYQAAQAAWGQGIHENVRGSMFYI